MLEYEYYPLNKFNELLPKLKYARKNIYGVDFFWIEFLASGAARYHTIAIPIESEKYYVDLFRQKIKKETGENFILGYDDTDRDGNYSFDVEQDSKKKLMSLSEQRTHRNLTPEAVEFLKSFMSYQNSLEDLQNVIIKFFKESVMQTKNLQAFMQSDAVGISEMEAIQSVFKHTELIIDGIKKSREATNLVFEKWKI